MSSVLRLSTPPLGDPSTRDRILKPPAGTQLQNVGYTPITRPESTPPVRTQLQNVGMISWPESKTQVGTQLQNVSYAPIPRPHAGTVTATRGGGLGTSSRLPMQNLGEGPKTTSGGLPMQILGEAPGPRTAFAPDSAGGHAQGFRNQIGEHLKDVQDKWKNLTPLVRFFIFFICIFFPLLYAIIGLIKGLSAFSTVVAIIMLLTSPLWLTCGLRLFLDLPLWDEMVNLYVTLRNTYDSMPDLEKFGIFLGGMAIVILTMAAGIVAHSFICEILGVTLLLTSPCWILFGLTLLCKLPFWGQIGQAWQGDSTEAPHRQRPPQRIDYTAAQRGESVLFKMGAVSKTPATLKGIEKTFSEAQGVRAAPTYQDSFSTVPLESIAPAKSYKTTKAENRGARSTSPTATSTRPLPQPSVAYRSASRGTEPLLPRESSDYRPDRPFALSLSTGRDVSRSTSPQYTSGPNRYARPLSTSPNLSGDSYVSNRFSRPLTVSSFDDRVPSSRIVRLHERTEPLNSVPRSQVGADTFLRGRSASPTGVKPVVASTTAPPRSTSVGVTRPSTEGYRIMFRGER